MEVKFRIANIDDIEGIVNLCNECFLENTSIEYAKEIFKKYESDENQIYVIGEHDGKIIAHTKITVIPTMFENMKTYSILNHVCVKEEYRRHHIGMRLMEECERISKSKGCDLMQLWSNNYRLPAQRLYRKYGFIPKDAQFFSKVIER